MRVMLGPGRSGVRGRHVRREEEAGQARQERGPGPWPKRGRGERREERGLCLNGCMSSKAPLLPLLLCPEWPVTLSRFWFRSFLSKESF